MCDDPAGHARTWTGSFTPRRIAAGLAVLLPDRTSWPAPANIVVVEDGDGVALIEAGLGTEHAVAALDRALGQLGWDLGAVHTLVCTHAHVDHAGGLAPLAHGRRLLIPAGSRAALDDPSVAASAILPGVVRRLTPALDEYDAGAHFTRDCGARGLPPDARVEEVRPGDVVGLGRYQWQAVATPGHEAHLLSFVEPSLRALAYSDLLVSRGTAIPWYAPGGGGTEAYLRGLAEVAGHHAELGLSGHGSVLPSGHDVRAAVDATADRIRERRHRIMSALRGGPVQFADLERLVYPPAVHEVIPWASSVAATHLVEALSEGWAEADLVTRDGRETALFAATKAAPAGPDTP